MIADQHELPHMHTTFNIPVRAASRRPCGTTPSPRCDSAAPRGRGSASGPACTERACAAARPRADTTPSPRGSCAAHPCPRGASHLKQCVMHVSQKQTLMRYNASTLKHGHMNTLVSTRTKAQHKHITHKHASTTHAQARKHNTHTNKHAYRCCPGRWHG